MAHAALGAGSLNKLSVFSTAVDGALALRRGRPRRAAVLLGAAALGSRVKGLGTAASVLVRVWRRLR